MFSIVCVARVFATVYVVWAVRTRRPIGETRVRRWRRRSRSTQRPVRAARGTDAAVQQPCLQRNRNRAAVVPLESPEGPRGMTRLACQRIYFAGGRGLCLGEGGGTAALD